ncbi:MAG: class I SAM-dependent methyltransferase [Gammaproteobacteria bacterium]|nr:class I SAM-dependent methyltransferase [Gammaproteobacteria bacterium]
MTLQSKWDHIYSQKTAEPTASLVLTENKHLLPSQGSALDLACGQGGNARLLAGAGLDVLAWDLSPVAIKQLRDFTALNALSIDAQVHDVLEFPPKANSLDVLVVSFFLDRSLCPKLIDAVKPGGLMFYQTYCQEKVNEQGPKNPEFLLADNELLALFSSMKVRVYREESLLGNQQKGWRNQALLVTEKGLT